MKREKKLKLVLIISVIVLISLISFVGIYEKNMNAYKNIVPEYLLSKDLNGYRRVELSAIDGENATSENYNKAKTIIAKRIEAMGENDYIIRQNSDNGKIIIEIPENENTDRIVGQVSLQGKFEIVDNETNEVLMTNEDIKNVESGYGATANNITVVFLNINFNEQGTEKFKNISNTYVETYNENADSDETENTTKKMIAIKIDGEILLTTYFASEISNGVLQLTVGSSQNSTSEDLKEYYVQANSMQALLDSGEIPVSYQLEQNKYILSEITSNDITIIVIIMIIIALIVMAFMCIKYKKDGILASISSIGYIALLLLAVRIFNVEISVAGIATIVFSIVIYYAILFAQLKQKEVLKVLGKSCIILIPALIISIVFTFANITMGPVLFWGLIIAMLYDASITNWMLKD